MALRLVPGGVLAAAAGAALMVAVSSGPSSAFTLSSPSLDQPVAAAGLEQAYYWGWHHWGWHRWGWHRWGWHPWGWRPYYHPWRRCWWTWYGRACRWY